MPPPPRKVKAKIDDAWSNMDNEKKNLVVFAAHIMKGECNHNPDRPDAKYLFKCDGNWMKPGGMITCPRIGSSMIVRLLDWTYKYHQDDEQTKKALEVHDLEKFPLWLRCACARPNAKIAVHNHHKLQGILKLAAEEVFKARWELANVH